MLWHHGGRWSSAGAWWRTASSKLPNWANRSRLRRVGKIAAASPRSHIAIHHSVEFGRTDELFVRPRKKQTEDYITGRFG